MMSPELQRRLALVRSALSASPDVIVACDVREGAPASACRRVERWPAYADLLRVTDGLRLGAFVIWGSDVYESHQYRIEDRRREGWLGVGQIDIDPLAIDLANDLWLIGDPREDVPAERRLGSLDEALEMALGSRYLGLVGPGHDDWCDALVRIGLVPA